MVALLLVLWGGVATAQAPSGGDRRTAKDDEQRARQQKILDELWPQIGDHSQIVAGEEAGYVFDPDSGDATYYAIGGVRWDLELLGNGVRLWCDSLIVIVPRAAELARSDDAPIDPSDPTAKVDWGQLEFRFWAEGNVRIELVGRATTIGADAFFFDRSVPIGVAQNGRIETTLTGLRGVLGAMKDRDVRGTRPHPRDVAPSGIPLTVTAKTLATSDFKRFRGAEVEVTHCDCGVPRVTVAASEISVEAEEVGDSASRAGERDDGYVGADAPPAYYLIDLEDTRLEIEEAEVLPLPLSYWDTRWHDYLPIRSVDVGSSSKFGFETSIDWNINFFLRYLPLGDARFARDLIRRSRLDFETTYLSKRGGGYGPKGEWGRTPRSWQPWQVGAESWSYYGEGRHFRIRDDGVDRSLGSTAPPDADRWWNQVYHRQTIPYLGILDIEYSEWSDPNFLNEYWESIFKQEKQQENLFYLRQNIGDNAAAAWLYKYRSNSFDSVVERLPEARVGIWDQQLFDSGVYTDLTARATNLRIRPADRVVSPTQRYGRADLMNEWSYPISWLDPYLQMRPFAFARYTAYEEVLDAGKGGEDRGAFGAGMTVSQQWSRTFPTAPESFLREWFAIDGLKHIVAPKVTYRNLFANDLATNEVIGVDEVDTVGLQETVAVSLRQALITRQRDAGPANTTPLLRRAEGKLEPVGYYQRDVLESEISFIVYPHASRDNSDDSLSFLVLDNTLNPGAGLSLRSWVALDPNRDFRGERIETSLTADLIPDRLALTIGDVYTRAAPGTGLDDANWLYFLLSAYPDDKWRAQLYWSHDLESGREAEVSVTVGRIFRCFALLFEYSLDAGEDDGHSFSVNLQPLDLFTGRGFQRGRRW